MAPAGDEALKPAYRTLLGVVALIVLNAWLNRLFFLPGDSEFSESIERGYASMSRFFAAHPNPFGWNPYQYEGLPAHRWYLPVVPYGGALLIHLLPVFDADHVYRIFVTAAAVVGPATMFLFGLTMTRNRLWIFVAAVLYSMVSTSYPLFPLLDKSHGTRYVPIRMLLLTQYAEGPHNLGLTLLPLALAASWRAAIGRRFWEILAAAVLLALIPLTNWIAAFALAWCSLMMLTTGLGIAPVTGFLGRRLIYAAILAYLLAAFWLTPGFIDTTLLNWDDDTAFRTPAAQRLLLGLLLIGPLALRLLLLRWPKQYYLCFLLLCFSGFFLLVSSHYWWRITIIPEAWRYSPEMELFFFLLLAECCRLLWVSRRVAARGLAMAMPAALLIGGWYQVRDYIYVLPMNPRPTPTKGSIEYRVSEAIAEQAPRGRVFVTGGTRFRFNSWFLIPQLGGTFETGLANRYPLDLIYFVRKGLGRPPETRADDAILALRAVGVEYVAVHGPESREFYRDFNDPEIFEGRLERVFEDEDDRVYRLPFRGWAYLVRPRELPLYIPRGENIEQVRPLVAAMDDSARPPLVSNWEGTSRIDIQGHIPPGYWITLPVSYHQNWVARQDGEQIPAESDVMGHVVLKPRQSSFSEIVLRYEPDPGQVAGTVVSVTTLALVLAVVGWKVRRRRL